MAFADFLYRVRRSLRKRLRPSDRPQDDYDWGLYTHVYKDELRNLAKDYTQQLSAGDYTFVDGELKRTADIRPLHPNARLLYETVLQLSPRSVAELGCGGGDNLLNLSVLAPGIALHGFDISDNQIALLRQRSPNLKADVGVRDMTVPLPDDFLKVEVAYTQAVIMHIQTGDLHRMALANLFKLATKHVVLLENWARHPFLSDIRELHAQGAIAWPTLHVHYRISPEYNKPHAMVISRERLDYPELSDYRMLSEGTKPQ